MCVCVFSCSVMSNSFVSPCAVACQAPLSMEFSRQQYWSGLPLSSPGDRPDLGIKPIPLVSPALAGDSLLLVPPRKPQSLMRALLFGGRLGAHYTCVCSQTVEFLFSQALGNFCDLILLIFKTRLSGGSSAPLQKPQDFHFCGRTSVASLSSSLHPPAGVDFIL